MRQLSDLNEIDSRHTIVNEFDMHKHLRLDGSPPINYRYCIFRKYSYEYKIDQQILLKQSPFG